MKKITKLQIIKKVISSPCYVCKTDNKHTTKKNCKVCDGKGNYKENFYYHVYTDKAGKSICFSGDTVK
ncbi:MAG TPA: hypothetical protein VGB37_13020 [Candidatus Lokiarchaeia archaeon]